MYYASEECKDRARKVYQSGLDAIERKRIERREAYDRTPNRCVCCGVPLFYLKRTNKYCSHKCAAKIGNVGRVPTDKHRENVSNNLKKQHLPPKNKGTGKIEERKCICGKVFSISASYPKKTCSEQCRRSILSLGQSIRKSGSYGGRCKWYTVAGQKVQGTWERNIANLFVENHIRWLKINSQTHSFAYEIDGVAKYYLPDFFLEDFGIYIEVKGYWWHNDKEKMRLVQERYPAKRFVVVEKKLYKDLCSGKKHIMAMVA